jgi:uncharacterized iron-regulated protein
LEGLSFRVYRSDGTPTSLAALVKATDHTEVLLVGERHDDFRGHALQALMLQALAERVTDPGASGPGFRRLALSLESFERDVQLVLDEYLRGEVTEESFLRDARPWESYGAAQRPLMEIAREYGLPVLASNAPRRYANRVARLGNASLEVLTEDAWRWLPPLPLPEASAAYRSQWDSVAHAVPTDHADFGIEAQVLWDATMSHSIGSFLADEPGPALVMHVVGSFHVERGTGMPELVPAYAPSARVLSVVIVPVQDPQWFKDDHAALADFVVLTSNLPLGGRR